MSTLSWLTRSELMEIGLSTEDIEAFITLRTHHGPIERETLEREDNAMSKAAMKRLLKHLNTSDNTHFDTFPRLSLTLEPYPPIISVGVHKLVINYHSAIDDELRTATLTTHLRGPSKHNIYDISQKHIIELTVVNDDGGVISKRTLTPTVNVPADTGDNTNSISNTLTSDVSQRTWVAEPSLKLHEFVSDDGNETYSLLLAETYTPVAITAFNAILPKHMLRTGRFKVIGKPDFRFDNTDLSVALVTEDIIEALTEPLGITAQAPGYSRFRPDNTSAMSILNRVMLNTAELDFEGVFNIEQPLPSIEGVIGWLWVLSGSELIIGYMPDTELSTPRHGLVIMLAQAGLESNGQGVPYNVTEKSMLDRPDLFGDDPGTSCRPFDNPGRTLGERRFSTVLRVTQPYVEGARRKTIAFDDETRRPVDFPRQGVDEHNGLEYEGRPAVFQAKTVTIGHVLEHAVRYRSNGYSLGDVAYSMTLAPRQKRQIVKLDYSRQDIFSRQEDTVSDDEVEDSVDRARDYDNAVESELDEWSRGRSKAKAKAGAAGIGLAAGPVVIGGGAVTTSASSSSSQEGGRNAAASETQKLRDSIRRFGQSLRTFQSTVVRETEQNESIEAVSEVVQNINYTRSLSIIYYEILRHIRVDTEIAGVRECIFVPMAVKPFTNSRIKRHKDVLRRYARGWKERLAFKHLEHLPDNIINSDIPAGKRLNQDLTTLSGTLYINMGIEMPDTGDELEEVNKHTDRTVYEREILRLHERSFLPFAGYFPIPVSHMVRKVVAASEHVREQYFQTEIAPHMARRYCDDLTLTGTDGKKLEADFTMTGKYSYGGTVRVDFTVDVAESCSRGDLTKLTVKLGLPPASGSKMPAKSFMNVKRCTINYANSHYRARSTSDTGARDLVDPLTGEADTNGASLSHPLSHSDEQNLHEEIVQAYKEFKARIEAKPFFYHKAIWWNMDHDELYTLLDGFSLSDNDGRSLASLAERRPIGILGNTLIFKTSSDVPIDPMFDTFEDLKNHYIANMPPRDPMRISLPTDGLYARAHMDGCVAAEEHNGSFDWVFDNSEPELASLPSNIFDSRRASTSNMAPTELPNTIINLQNAPEAPQVSGLGDAFSAVGNANAFRDMAGLEGTQANARAAMQNAAGLANNFGNMAFQTRMAQLKADADAARDIRATNAAIERERQNGSISDDDAKELKKRNIENRLNLNPNESEKNQHEIEKKVVESEEGGTVTTTDKNGTRQVTKNSRKPREPDPVSKISVIPLPPDEILFMNFATDKATLKPDHKKALEILVGEVGLKIDNIEKIVGHASPSGNEKHNFEIAEKRAIAIWSEMHKLLNPIKPTLNYTASFLENQGENSSYREKYKHINPVINDIDSGASGRNDPVEKAVLLKMKFNNEGDIDFKPKIVSFFGMKISITSHIVIIKNYLFYGHPDGTVKCVDRNTYNVVKTLEQTDNSTIDNSNTDNSTNDSSSTFNLDEGTKVQNGENGIVIIGSNNVVNITRAEDGSFTKKVEAAEKDKPHQNWRISFGAPNFDGASRTLKSVLDDLLDALVSIPEAAIPAALQEVINLIVVAEGSGSDPMVALIEHLNLTSALPLIDNVAFGSIKLAVTIKAATDNRVEQSGTLSGPGIVIGSMPTGSSITIVDDAPYTTAQGRRIDQWDDFIPGGSDGNEQRFMKEFFYFNNGTTQAAESLATGVNVLVSNIIPALPVGSLTEPVLRTISGISSLLSRFTGASGFRFQAFEGDSILKPEVGQVVETGLDFSAVAIRRNTMTFKPD